MPKPKPHPKPKPKPSTYRFVAALLLSTIAAHAQCGYPCGPPHQTGVSDITSGCFAGLNCDTGATIGAFQAKLRLELNRPLRQGSNNWILRICGPATSTINRGAPLSISIDGFWIPPVQLSGYPLGCALSTPFNSYYATTWPFSGVCCFGAANVPWPWPLPGGLVGASIYSQAVVLDGPRLVLSQTIVQVVQP